MSIQQNINQLLTLGAAGGYIGKQQYIKGIEKAAGAHSVQRENIKSNLDYYKSELGETEYAEKINELEKKAASGEKEIKAAMATESPFQQKRIIKAENKALAALHEDVASRAERETEYRRPEREAAAAQAEYEAQQAAEQPYETTAEEQIRWMDNAISQINTRQKHQELLKQLKEKDPGTYAIYGERALEWEGGK